MITLHRIFIVLLAINSCSPLDYRLPTSIIPTFYDLSLTIDPANNDYSGTVNITLQTSTDSDEIYIHEDGDSITIGSVILNNNAKCYPGSPNEADISVITCTRSLILDEDNSLYIEFTGKFSEKDGYGLIKSKFGLGKNEQLAIESNFKPTYARRAFPCLDEPDFKANFSVTVTHPSDYIAISNSPAVESTKKRDDVTITKFENTPAISTYLVSIFLPKFKEVKTPSVENVDYKIYTRPEITDSNSVANTYYPQIIKKLDDYTGVPYENLSDTESLLVAVPEYYDAMGDFGFFAYRETDLLDEGDKTTSKVKQNIIKTMAYKVSHEWYGGDVATKWWSDIWANEAVATYLQYIIADEVDEDLELTNQFLLEVTQKMLQYDGYSFAQALSSKESDINDDWEIENKLNIANYGKGSSILHMITVIVGGKDNFQTALQNHWKNRKEADTDGIDILKDLLAGKSDDETDYYKLLEKWVFSPGYPLLTVKMKDEDNATDIATVTQKRFLYPTNETATTEDASEWCVPLTSATESGGRPYIVDVFLKPDNDMMYFFGHGSWLVFNTQGGSFYRVNYDEELWRRILDGLKANRSSFHVLQRSLMVDDILSVARIGDVSYSLAFEMVDLLVNETEYYPWYSAFNAFSYLLQNLEDEGVVLNLKKYILNLMENITVIPKDNFIDEADSHIDVLKKVMVLNWACKLGQEGCITYATKKFNEYRDIERSLDDYNAREIIFCNGIRYSDSVQADWNFLWAIYTVPSSVHEESDVLKALGCAENKDILQSYLMKIITTDSLVKRQDALLIFKSVFSSSLGLEVAMDFLQNNASNIQNFYKDMRITSEMVYMVAEKLSSDDQIIWLKNLLSNTVFDGYEDVRSKATTLALVNNYWQKNFQSGVVDIFPAPTTQTSPTTESSSDTTATSTYTLPFVILIFAVIKLKMPTNIYNG